MKKHTVVRTVQTIRSAANPIHRQYGLWILNFRRNARHATSSQIRPRAFQFYGISHLISGKGWYWNEQDGRRCFTAGQGVISTPGFVQSYGGDDADYVEDLICFQGPIADHLLEAGILGDGICSFGMGRRLCPIIEYAENPADDSQVRANLALQNLLVELYFEKRQKRPDSHQGKIEGLIEAIKNRPEKWWTAAEMAEMCELSKNHFRQLFKKATGLNPKAFIDQIKMKQAAEQLLISADSVARIAEQFGYTSPYHFSNRFKDLFGMSPDHYRRNMA